MTLKSYLRHKVLVLRTDRGRHGQKGTRRGSKGLGEVNTFPARMRRNRPTVKTVSYGRKLTSLSTRPKTLTNKQTE